MEKYNLKALTSDQRKLDKQLEKLSDDPMYDGVIDLKSYCQAPLKILWILKEVNDDGGYDQRKSFRDEITMSTRGRGWWRTLDPIIYVSYSILNNFPTWQKMDYISDNPEMINVL